MYTTSSLSIYLNQHIFITSPSVGQGSDSGHTGLNPGVNRAVFLSGVSVRAFLFSPYLPQLLDTAHIP